MYIATLFAFFLAHTTAMAGEVINIDKTEGAFEAISKLNESYANAGHHDTSKALFSMEELTPAWIGVLNAINQHLKAEGLKWEGPLPTWQRLYFAEDGTIEIFFYRLRDDTLDEANQELFHKAIESFVQTAQFGLQADQKFAQCGSARFMYSAKGSENGDTDAKE